MQNKADTELVRRQNRGLILEALRRFGMMARVELGRTTGLSPATISAITADLIAENLIVAADIEDQAGRPPGRGRPRVALALNPDAAYVLGLKISLNAVTFILCNYNGRIVDSARHSIDTLGAEARSFVPRLAEQIRAYLAARRIAVDEVPQIPVAIPGVVDRTTGRLVWSPTVSLEIGAVPGPLSEIIGISASMTNDVDMMAQALNARDPQRFGGTFAVIFIESGIGMGLFINGRPFAGAFGSGAEFGHTNHVPGGMLCRCGRRGCIEAYLADYALYRAVAQEPTDGSPAETDPDAETMARLEARARRGDEVARAAYRQAGLALGYGLSRLMGLINPQRIVLTGRGVAAFDLLKEGFDEGIKEGLVAEIARMTEIEVLSPEDDLVEAGILAGALQRLDREIFASSDHRPVQRRQPGAA